MAAEWRPKQMRTRLHTQVAYNADRIHFRFRWRQPDPGGWLHDMLVYRDGGWEQFASPSPWAAAGEQDAHNGFYEDRVSFLLDDGSVRGFEQFGGWLTVHDGMRSLPDEVSETAVRRVRHFGESGIDTSDIRKYIPQACEGEWWENDWRAMRSPEELAELKASGLFLDLPMWRAHRSNPIGYGTDHHVLDYRHSDEGQNTYTTQSWDRESGPAFMWDPAVVDDGALDYFEIEDGVFPDQQEGTYALELEDAVPFDPDVAEWDGAMIPRRPLQEPHGSAADWRASGVWGGDEWLVEIWRDLRTDHPEDTTQLTPGRTYTWSPAVHHGAGQRWHWVAFPYRLGLGITPEAGDDRATLVAEEFSGATPEWDRIETHTVPLIFPGLLTWDDLISERHPRSAEVRSATVSLWDLYEYDPASFLS